MHLISSSGRSLYKIAVFIITRCSLSQNVSGTRQNKGANTSELLQVIYFLKILHAIADINFLKNLTLCIRNRFFFEENISRQNGK